MLQSELHELDEIKGLVTKGQQQGVLSYTEVADAVSEIDLDETDVEELYGYLEKSEIELARGFRVPAARIGGDPAGARGGAPGKGAQDANPSARRGEAKKDRPRGGEAGEGAGPRPHRR